MTRRLPVYILVGLLFMAVFRNLDLTQEQEYAPSIRGQFCPVRNVVTVRTGATTTDCNKAREGAVCGNMGRPDEAYCSKHSIDPARGVRGSCVYCSMKCRLTYGTDPALDCEPLEGTSSYSRMIYFFALKNSPGQDNILMFLTGLGLAVTLYRITRNRSADADSEMVPADSISNPTLFKRLLSSGLPRGVDAV